MIMEAVMHMKKTVALVVAMTVGGLGWGASFRMPRGRWWDNPRLVRYLGLTPDQQARIHDTVFDHAERMIDLNAAVKQAELQLEDLAGRDTFDEKAVRAAFAKLQEARRALENERFELLIAVRKILTASQWKKLVTLREELRRHGAGMRRMGRRPGMMGRQRGQRLGAPVQPQPTNRLPYEPYR